jgi:CubicO group peptidase (beta-lactamase class C family)
MTRTLCGGATLACLIFAAMCTPVAAQTGASPFPTSRFVAAHPELPTAALRLHATTGATLRGGEVHRYALRLEAGQFAAVRIPQIQGNLVAVIFDPGGKLMGIVDQNGAGLAEVATIDARKTGDYAIQIAMFEWDAAEATYQIEWTRRERAEREPTGRARQLFESWHDPERPGAVLLVLRGGQIAYEGAIGIENASSRRPLSVQSPIDLASISKQFTAYGIALLVERGQLTLSDDIRRYLPEMPDYGAKITIQHLLEHTSGIRDWDGMFGLIGRNVEDGISADDVLAMAARQKSLTFATGHEQRYSNTGYVLLAKIIERVTRQPFDRWTKENIFEPLDMRECGLSGDAAAPARVVSYRAQYPASVPSSDKRTVSMGSSGLTCSAHDLAIWLDNYQSGRLGGETARALVTRPPSAPTSSESDYVFGNWHSKRNGHVVVGHQGLSAGYRTSLHSFPAEKLAVIYLANDGNDATYERVRTIEDLFLGIPATDIEAPNEDYSPAAPVTLRDEVIAQLVGRYHSEELMADYEIVRSGQGVVAQHRDAGTIRLSPNGTDTFSSDKWFVPSLTFVRDGAGVVEGFQIESEDVGLLRFMRTRAGTGSSKAGD